MNLPTCPPRLSVLTGILVLAAASLVACASPKGGGPGAAALTAADVDAKEAPSSDGALASAASASAEPPAAREASAASTAGDNPLGANVDRTSGEALVPNAKLVCTTKDEFGVTSELHLAWSGKEAEGYVRRFTPSGATDTVLVHAERDGAKIIVDKPGETDLTAHVAVVGEHSGKRLMRLGREGATWLRCE